MRFSGWRLIIFLVLLPLILAYFFYRWIYLFFRWLWKSNLDLRVKWGTTGAIALVFIVVGITSFTQSTAPPVLAATQATSTRPSAQVQAALPTTTATSVPSASPTPAATLAPTLKPIVVPVAPKATVRPTQRPLPPPPAFNYCGAPANPWHYNFCAGNVIYSPPSNFCSYFPCIPSFWKSTNGYAEECVDGMYSHSGGRSGACSYHNGELRPLLQ